MDHPHRTTTPGPVSPEVETAVRYLLYAYCRGIDRRDADLVRSVFWPDSIVRTSTTNGSGAELPDRVFAHMDRIGMGVTQHSVSNIFVTEHEGRFYAETYLTAYHRVHPADGPVHDVVTGVRYQDRVEERNERWRIAERMMIFDWFREYPDTGDWDTGTKIGPRRAVAIIGEPGPGPWQEFEQAFTLS